MADSADEKCYTEELLLQRHRKERKELQGLTLNMFVYFSIRQGRIISIFKLVTAGIVLILCGPLARSGWGILTWRKLGLIYLIFRQIIFLRQTFLFSENFGVTGGDSQPKPWSIYFPSCWVYVHTLDTVYG